MVWQFEEVNGLRALRFELFPVRLPSLLGVAALVASFVDVEAPYLLCANLLVSSSALALVILEEAVVNNVNLLCFSLSAL